jgi:hypothetical protein
MSDLIRTATEIATSAIDGSALEVAQKVIADAGGFVVKTTGQIVIGGLVQRGYEKLFEEYQRRKDEKKISDDFEQTDHGAKLLQEALEAMSRGLDEDQADAVRKVFLGLASNPPRDSMERIQQLEILATASSLTPWEIATLNVLERLSKELYDIIAYEHYESIQQNQRDSYQTEMDRRHGKFASKLDRFTENQTDYRDAIIDGLDSLSGKRVIRYGKQNSYLNMSLFQFVVRRNHWLTDFGWKLAVYLYSIDNANREQT